jgi:hypothetical protein
VYFLIQILLKVMTLWIAFWNFWGFLLCWVKVVLNSNLVECIKYVTNVWQKPNDEQKNCCIFFVEVDCLIIAAKEECGSSGYENVRKLITGFIKEREKWYDGSEHNGWKCYSPYWLLIIVIVVVIVKIVVIVLSPKRKNEF